MSYSAREREAPFRELLIPELNSNTDIVVRYLMGRGIHPAVIDHCLKHKLLFETKQYHNAMFVGYDMDGKARYAALRGTKSGYKGEVTGSDKRYSFSLVGTQNTDTVHLFESAIDLMSYATFQQLLGRDWTQESLLSLAGVYQTKREGVVPVALSRFLSDYPNTKELRLHLDNDEVGREAVQGIIDGLKGKYVIRDEPPRYGKDVNDALQRRLGLQQRKESYAR